MRKLKHSEIVRASLDELCKLERHPITVLLENIRSAHNVGSIIRSADAILAEQVILTGVTPDGSHKGVHKSALGAQDAVPWTHNASAVDAARRLKTDGYTIVALEHTDESISIDDLSHLDFPVCLMVGNEVSGLSDELVNLADVAIEIPQFGLKQSLNVSVATGIALYRLLGSHQQRSNIA